MEWSSYEVSVPTPFTAVVEFPLDPPPHGGTSGIPISSARRINGR
ncbi:MAG: hypothetical protein ACXWNE_11705 [Candidatus Binataceae bacterium]